MSRQPAGGGDATWKGLLIIAGAVVLGLGVASTIGSPGTGLATSNGVDQPTEKSTTTSKVTSTEQVTTSSSIPLKANKEVKVLVANGTKTSGATKKITDALKPACYTVATPVDTLAKVKDEKRPTSTIYSTPGFEREAALLATKLGLQTSANAALPASPPIPTKGVPSYNVLVLMAQDLVDSPPPALPAEDCGTGGSSTTSTGGTATTKSSSGTKATTTTAKKATSTTAAKATTTTKAATTTSAKATTTTTAG